MDGCLPPIRRHGVLGGLIAPTPTCRPIGGQPPREMVTPMELLHQFTIDTSPEVCATLFTDPREWSRWHDGIVTMSNLAQADWRWAADIVENIEGVHKTRPTVVDARLSPKLIRVEQELEAQFFLRQDWGFATVGNETGVIVEWKMGSRSNSAFERGVMKAFGWGYLAVKRNDCYDEVKDEVARFSRRCQAKAAASWRCVQS